MMQPYWHNEQHGLSIYHGDCLDVLAALPEGIAQTCVTSPPYWGLRDYGTAEWIGGDPDCKHECSGQVQDSKAQGAIANGVRPGCDASTCRKCGAVRVDRQLGLERGMRQAHDDYSHDKDCWIYELAETRLEKEIAQGRLFEPAETQPKPVQTTLEVQP